MRRYTPIAPETRARAGSGPASTGSKRWGWPIPFASSFDQPRQLEKLRTHLKPLTFQRRAVDLKSQPPLFQEEIDHRALLGKPLRMAHNQRSRTLGLFDHFLKRSLTRTHDHDDLARRYLRNL